MLLTAQSEQAAAEAARTVGAEPLRPDVTDPGLIAATAIAKDTISLDPAPD
jgi:hypothetical protein